ncbi:MAG: hypothetical protein M3R53_05085 [Candidatus Eremiobacteraeota bacterium]|nr:hypothetical protein [Candidatus Eremiobacteraeota bacterium]
MRICTILATAVAVTLATNASARAELHAEEVSGLHGTISLPSTVVAVNAREHPGDNVTLNPQPLPPKILVLGSSEATINAHQLARIAPGTACGALVVSVRTADGAMHSTHATGDASGSRCV